MFRHLGLALLALFGFAGSAAAQVDINVEKLLAALTQGAEATLLTPATNGMVQVTSFLPPRRYAHAEAAELVEAARRKLADAGIARPSGDQLAAALVELLPGGAPVQLRTEVVFAAALPQLIAAPAR